MCTFPAAVKFYHVKERKSQGGSGCYLRVKQVKSLNHKSLKHTNDSAEIKAFISFDTAVEKGEENVINKET